MEVASQCKFCEIVAGRAAAAIVYSDRTCIAFLDSRPVFRGHTLIIPRVHYQALPELPSDLLLPLFKGVRLLAMAVQVAMDAEGTFIAINNHVSQSVPHLHVHIIPRRRRDGLRGFLWPRQKYADMDEVETVRERIAGAVAKVQANQ